MAESWNIEWAVGPAARANAIRAQWHAAHAARRSHVFHRPAVIDAWHDTIGDAAAAIPVQATARSTQGATVLLAGALMPQAGRALTRRTLQAVGLDVFGYHDPLRVSGEVSDWDTYWTAIRATAPGDANQASFRLVHPELAGRMYALADVETSPVLSLEQAESFDATLASCSANHRGDVRRRIRRIAERGELRFDVFACDDGKAALREFDQHCWPVWSAHGKARGWALASQPGVYDYCQRLLSTGLVEGWAHFAVLRSGGESIAWHLGLADDRRLYWWLPVHRDDWEAWSPGKLLLAKTVEWLIDNKWRALDLLTGAQPYKLAWGPTMQHLSAVRWYAPSTTGRVLGLYDRVMQKRKRP